MSASTLRDALSPHASIIRARVALARQIRFATGLSPYAASNAETFDLRSDLPCTRCQHVTATALLDDSTRPEATPQRLCIDCTEWL